MTVSRANLTPLLAAIIALTLLGCGDDDKPTPPPAKVADSSARYPVGDPAAQKPAMIPVQPAPRPTSALPVDASCMTAECHADYTTKRQIHGPVGAGDCSACHAEDTGGHVYPMKRGVIETCTFCHNIAGSRAHVHLPTLSPTTGCMSCHDPHASGAKFLLNSPRVETTCAECHAIEPKRFTHSPMAQGQCTLCHEPHEADNPMYLRGGEGANHCFLCHEDMKLAVANSPVVHEPVREGCAVCHDPHATEFPFQLRQSMQQTCFECHEDLEQQIAGARSPHAAVFTGDQCANCHDPHAAGRPSLLRARTDELCLNCHDKPIEMPDGRTLVDMRPLIEGKRFLHGPIRTGECQACHNAHGSTNSRLLRDKFPESFYASFDLNQYALCFECHDPALVMEENTSHLTEFRDGDRNLHYIHVHRQEKGRTCKTCHAIHGSDQPNHMADVVRFEDSDWTMELNYQPVAGGGSCAPGCHEPFTYQRGDSPITEPREEGAP